MYEKILQDSQLLSSLIYLRLFLCDNGLTAVGGAASLAKRTQELLVDRVVADSF